MQPVVRVGSRRRSVVIRLFNVGNLVQAAAGSVNAGPRSACVYIPLDLWRETAGVVAAGSCEELICRVGIGFLMSWGMNMREYGGGSVSKRFHDDISGRAEGLLSKC